ncbi:MAG: hypothetical protein ACOYXR_09300 [Nitrospirota bacterium]
MQKFTVVFDDGATVEAEVRSRDLVRLEEAGIDLEAVPPMRGSYILAHAALQRMARQGLTDVAVPETVEALMDVADLEAVEDGDPEGKG